MNTLWTFVVAAAIPVVLVFAAFIGWATTIFDEEQERLLNEEADRWREWPEE